MTASLIESTAPNRSKFASVITQLAERFVNLTLEQLDAGIEEALAVIGQYTGAHRTTIFEFSASHTHISNTYEWCADGVSSQKASGHHLPITAFPWIMTQHERGEVIHIPDVEALPAAAASEKRAFQRDGVKSLITVPLVLGDKPLGFLGLSSLQAQPWWSPELLALLRLAGEILGNALARRHSALLLSERDERYRILVETSPDGIFSYQGNRITFINSTGLRLIGATHLTDVIGKSPFDLIHADDHTSFIELHQQVVNSVHILPYYTAKVVCQNGRTVDVEMGAASFVEHGEKAFLVILRDITERKRLEEQLTQAAKMEAIGRLAGGIAHDFNNLLTAIMGYNALNMEGLLPGEPQHEYANEMSKAIDRAVILTRQLLTFSRRQGIQPQPFDVSVVIRHLLSVLRPLLGENIRMTTDLGTDTGMVALGPGQLDQVIINLAVNARDAMPQGGQLTIATTSVDGGATVRLTVADTGIGMDETTRRHLFEPFFTTKPEGKGTGLGLATVYTIVKQNGGEIRVNSTPGQGATFVIDWPRLTQPSSGQTVNPTQSPGHLHGTGTILVIEDDEIVLTFIKTTLSAHGYQVFAMQTGQVALAFQQQYQHKIDLILTDLLLPGINGVTLVEQMNVERPDTKALFISGYDDETLQQHNIHPLSIPLMRKPFSSRTLLQTIKTALQKL